jgi:hypothetical protein
MAVEILKRLIFGLNNAHFMIKPQHRSIASRTVMLDASIEDAEMGATPTSCL